jgi:hypothetical protein
VTYHIYRPKNSDTTYGISIREDGAMLYHSGSGFGIYYEGKFTSQDLDLIVKMDLELAKEIELAFEKLEQEGYDF